MKLLLVCALVALALPAMAKPGGFSSRPSPSFSRPSSPSFSRPAPSYRPSAPTSTPRRAYAPPPPPARVIVQQSGPSPLFWALWFSHSNRPSQTTVIVQCDTVANPYCNQPDEY